MASDGSGNGTCQTPTGCTATDVDCGGPCIATGEIVDAAVTDVKLAADSVTSAKIVDLTIAAGDLADNAVTLAKLATGSVTSAKILDGSIVNVDIDSTASVRIRGINYIAGCDSCATLDSTIDDQKTIYQNVVGLMHITQVTCFADTGLPTINLQRDDGITTPPLPNILNAAIDCDGTAKTNFNGTQYILDLGNRIDFDLVSVTTAHRVTVVVKAVLQ